MIKLIIIQLKIFTSCLGWWWWPNGEGRRRGEKEKVVEKKKRRGGGFSFSPLHQCSGAPQVSAMALCTHVEPHVRTVPQT